MSLSYIGCDWEDMKQLIVKLNPDLTAKAKWNQQHLGRFADLSIVSSELQVTSTGLDWMQYLVWTDGTEEAVLNVQGILAEAYLPPICGSPIKTLTKSYQSMKIVGVKDDDLFKDALKAIDNIKSFMARHHPDLTSTVLKNAPIEPDRTLDGERVLQEIIHKGMHILTYDNSIHFYEYSPREGSNSAYKQLHPGTLKAGDVIDIGILFRVIDFSKKAHFQARKRDCNRKWITLSKHVKPITKPWEECMDTGSGKKGMTNPVTLTKEIPLKVKLNCELGGHKPPPHQLSMPNESSLVLTATGIEQLSENVRGDSWYTCIIRTGMFYSNCAVDPAFVSVTLHNHQVRNIKVTDFNTECWVHDVYAHIYMTPLGNEVVTLSESYMPSEEMPSLIQLSHVPFQMFLSFTPLGHGWGNQSIAARPGKILQSYPSFLLATSSKLQAASEVQLQCMTVRLPLISFWVRVEKKH
ncbi:hypothetical protein ARMGADRAFT_1029550 [Armillaria gallica]|uniref:Uncharacterized protein n=1 Tax=Armillaria gallica TaxID=47427 RepID=A0A2H3DUH7_ARMGA|nr:hypothetical protein ARMGADRAFT_1029550 [Armillaria gallica]